MIRALAFSVLVASALPAVADTLPGTDPYDEPLTQRIAQELSARGAGYVPRTRHLHEGGAPRYTNRLIFESSPYLRQHAHNPVNWYPWGDDAFETARRLGRPVLLSIGYSTCHWCHVMEEESFEDEEIAAFLNSNYVAIKVDREERPDLDAIYMSAVQILTGRGGWPMTTWLTPDREPFYGGTYFPPRDGDRGTRAGFLTLLQRLDEVYRERPEDVAKRAAEIATGIRKNLDRVTPAGEAPLDWTVFDTAVEQLDAQFDPVRGGLKRAPKFPSNVPNRLLLRQHLRNGDERALKIATVTLTRMAEGGMYDQVGGGFHRYSVDADWLVPHFEKMLYDNAQLAVAYLEAWQHTGDALFRRVAREILDYVAREMTSPEGGFYSATDADSLVPGGEMEEGWFFTWTPAELAAVLDDDERRAVELHFGVTPGGNFEGRSILHVASPFSAVSEKLGVEPGVLRKRLESARTKLYRHREGREPPLRDDKILTSWNAMMISAFARGGFVFDEPRYTRHAVAAAELLLSRLRDEKRLLRSYMDGQARHNGYLDDYATLIAALLDLFETTGQLRWFEAAVGLQSELDRRFGDPRGGYFATSSDHETLLAREKPASDGAEPAGNSVALMNLVRLHALTTDDRYRVAADRLLAAFKGVLVGAPRALPEMLLAADFKLGAPREVVLVHRRDRTALKPFLDVLRDEFLPRQVVVSLADQDVDAFKKPLPIVRGKHSGKTGVRAFVCEAGVCALPTSDPERFRVQLTQPLEALGPRKK